MANTTLIYSSGEVVSHSIIDTLCACPRNYELTYRLGMPKKTNVHFAYGHAMGIGIQSLLAGKSFEYSVLAATTTWVQEFGFHDGAPEKAKTIWHVIEMLRRFNAMISFKNNPFSDYELAYFNINGKRVPATELTFTIHLNETWKYDGHIDIVLKVKGKNRYVILELKTDGSNEVHELKYKNSLQALGYSCVLDSVSKTHYTDNPFDTSYTVFYLVVKPKTFTFEPFTFDKSLKQKFEFIQTVILKVQEIELYKQAGYFPKNGASCMRFNYPCVHADYCSLSNETVIQTIVTPRLEDGEEKPERNPHFTFSLEEIVNSIAA